MVIAVTVEFSCLFNIIVLEFFPLCMGSEISNWTTGQAPLNC
jgi:hypothetical protein